MTAARSDGKRDMTMKDVARLEREESREEEQRMARHGRRMFEMARKGGWNESDGEGPLEYIMRISFETGWEDRGPPASAVQTVPDNWGDLHYLTTVLLMAGHDVLLPQKMCTNRYAKERLMVYRCLDSFFTPRCRVVNLDLLRDMIDGDPGFMERAMPAFLWSLQRFAISNEDRSATGFIINGKPLGFEEACGIWTPLQDMRDK